MRLYTPTILGGNSYLSWFYDRGAIKDPAHTGTSKGLSQAINRELEKFLSKYANVYITIQSHCFGAGAQTHYATANGVRNGLRGTQLKLDVQGFGPKYRVGRWLMLKYICCVFYPLLGHEFIMHVKCIHT